MMGRSRVYAHISFNPISASCCNCCVKNRSAQVYPVRLNSGKQTTSTPSCRASLICFLISFALYLQSATRICGTAAATRTYPKLVVIMPTIPNYGAKLLQNLHIRKCSALKMHVKVQKIHDFTPKNGKNTKKCYFFAFFFENIWSCQKKAVPLHSLSKRKYDIRSRCYRLVA